MISDMSHELSQVRMLSARCVLRPCVPCGIPIHTLPQHVCLLRRASSCIYACACVRVRARARVLDACGVGPGTAALIRE